MIERLLLISLYFVCLINTVYAQENELDPVTISSTVTSEKTSKTGRNIYTINSEKIRHLPVNSIDELLRFIPGIEMQMRGASGSQGDISLRGSTFQQVLVILDGTRLNDPNTGHFSGYIPIAISEIERIEVLKGASSSVYGTEAVGGVIHIITRSFAAAKRDTAQKEFQLQAAGGEYNFRSMNGGGFYQKKKLVIGGGITSNNALGQPQRGTTGYFYNHTASVSFMYLINNKWTVALRSAFDKRSFSAQNFYTTFISDTAKEKVTTLWNQFKLVYEHKSSKLNFSMAYKKLDDEYKFNSVGIPNQNKSTLLQNSIIYENTANHNFSFVTGIQHLNKEINSNDRGSHNLDQMGVFFLINYKLSQAFIINPALRMDWIETIGAELVPQINLSYQLQNLQLRGSAGKTIRDADFTERFNNYNKPFVASGSIGNPSLQAERSLSYEAGADYFAGKNFKISGTFFKRDHSKLIDYVVTPYAEMPRKQNLSPTGSYALAKNIAKVTTTGFEADIQISKKFAENHTFWSALGIIWLQDESSSGVPSFYVSSHSKFLSNFNFHYTYRWLGISISTLYKKRDELTASNINAKVASGYFIINGRADVYVLKRTAAAFIQAENLFNEQYQDILGSQMPGRWLKCGVRFSFK